jgi:hypothetical protein
MPLPDHAPEPMSAQVTMYLTPDLYARLQKAAAYNDLTVEQYVQQRLLLAMQSDELVHGQLLRTFNQPSSSDYVC